MPEMINITDEVENNTAVGDMLLEAPEGVINNLVKDPNWKGDNAVVSLTINGHRIRVEEFDRLLDDWRVRFTEGVKEDLDFYKTEEAVLEKAKELLDEKLSGAYDVLHQIEESKWKLGD